MKLHPNRIGIFAKTFSGTMPEQVLLASAVAGFKSVQYNMACSGLASLPDEISDELALAVARAAANAHVKISAISATYNMAHPDKKLRENGRHGFEVVAAKAKMMGANLITLCTGSRDPDDQWRHHPDNQSKKAWADMAHEFEKLIAIAEREDLFLGIEPELGNVVSDPIKALKLIGQMKSHRLRIVFDAANLFERASFDEVRVLVEQGIATLAPYISLAHAKDRSAEGAPCAPGQGIIDFKHYLNTLHVSGFSGDIIAHGFGADEAAGVAAFIKSCA